MGLFTLRFYIFKTMLKMTLYFMLALAVLALLIDFNELSNRLANVGNFSAWQTLQISALRVPFILQVVTPFLVLGGTMSTLMQLNKKNELVVARSVGISAWQFLLPIWLFAFLTGCFAIFVVNPTATSGFSRATELESALSATVPTSGPLSDRNPWLRQQAEDGGTILIGAKSVSNRGIMLLDAVFIKLDADGNIIERLDSKNAVLNDKFWLLNTVTLTRPGSGSVPLIVERIPTKLDPAIVTQALVPAEMVPLNELGNNIKNQRILGVSTSAYEMQYHSLIALPALLVAMSLIGASVSLRFVRFGLSPAMVLGGIIAGFVLYTVTQVASSFGAAGILSPILAAWLPVIAASMFGVTYLLHREDG